MAARRRHRGRLALALAISLGVHLGVFLGVIGQRPPTRGEPGRSATPPVLIDLQRAPSAKAGAAHSAAAKVQGRPILQVVEPSPLSTPSASPSPAAAGSADPVAGQGAAGGPSAQARAGSGPAAGPTLKFDCPPVLGRPGKVRADPCEFRNASRDHLPDSVARQARIDSDKAAYYDRVLEERASDSSPPMLGCAILFGGGKAPSVKKPLHSLKLGPLPCFLIPPKGPLDPEVFVEPIPPKNPLKPGEMKE